MSAENQDEVIALMAQEGISRVKATKLLYELAKQRKKDAAKIELNINQGDNSTVKNQIERFSSQRDLSNATNQVHRDIDLSEEGRPVLKLDAEASFRYNSSGPHPPVPTEYVPPAQEPYQRQKSRSSPQRMAQSQQSPGLRERADTYGSSEDEVVVPYDEDKPFPESPPSRNKRGVAAGGGNTGDDSGGNGGWNGVLEEESPNAVAVSMHSVSNPAPKRRSSNSALNLRPLSRLHPNKFRDSLSPEDQDNDYDEEDSGSDPEGAAQQRERDGYRSGSTCSSDNEGDRLDGFNGSTFSQSESPRSARTTHSVPAAAHPLHPGQAGQGAGVVSVRATSSSSSTTSTSATFTSSHQAQQATQQGQGQFQRRAHVRDDSDSDGSPPPPQYQNNNESSVDSALSPPSYPQKQEKHMFTHGANDSWSAGSQSQSTSSPDRGGASSESKSFSQSSANVQQLAVEEKLALLNAGRSSTTAGSGLSSMSSPAPLTSTPGLMGPPSATNVKQLGSKKLTIRAAGSAASTASTTTATSSSVSQALMEEHHSSQEQRDQQLQARDLPPPPPPSYEESSTFGAPDGSSTPPSRSQMQRRPPGGNMDMPNVADEPLPDYYSDEEGDGLTQEQRTAALMAKYKRRSYMRPDNTPEAFRNLDPVDPAQIEEMLRQEQQRKEAAAAAIAAGRSPVPSPSAAATSDGYGGNNGTATPPQHEAVYVTEAPTVRAVEAVMQKESTDLIEELVAQGYSRENAISLAKEIELDRRAGRFGSGGPRSSYDSSASNPNPHANPSSYNPSYPSDVSPQRPGLPRPGQGSGASVASQSSYNNAQSWGMNTNNASYYNNGNSYKSNGDDDCSVISQISGVSRQSAASFCENDKLLMNLLLSQQKARYGVNMYESLSNSDEPTIERYMARGMTLDQAVLKVFERKYGPVDNQAMPRNMQSMSSKGHTTTSSTSSSIQYDSAEAQEIVGTMHAEIELLMLSGDYSRDVAVRMLLNKVARERAQQALGGGLSIDSDAHSHHNLQRSMSTSVMGSPKGRGASSVSGSVRNGSGGGYQGNGMNEYNESDFRSGGMHSARSMYDASTSRSGGMGGGSVISERSGRNNGANNNVNSMHSDVPMPHHHPGDHYHNQHQNDYIAQYHEQEYSRGPNGRGGGGGSVKGGDQYIIHHHYQSAPSEKDRQNRRRPSASNNSVKTANSGTSRTVDDREYLPTLLQEQESTYGVNMFEYLAPDDPEVSRLMNEFNFSRTDAMIAVFQQFPPVVASPTLMGNSNSGRSHHHRNLSGGSSSALGSLGSPRKGGNNNGGNGNNNNYTNPSSAGSHSSGVSGNNFFPPSSSSAGPSHSQYDEDAELERVMRLSMQEVAERPGAVSMPGVGAGSAMSISSGRSGGSSRAGTEYGQYNNHGHHSGSNSGGGGGGASGQDVAALVGMGFTSAQAHDALARHNFDVHKAANYLLGGA